MCERYANLMSYYKVFEEYVYFPIRYIWVSVHSYETCYYIVYKVENMKAL